MAGYFKVGPVAVLREARLNSSLAPYAGVVINAFNGNTAFPNAGPKVAAVKAAYDAVIAAESAPKGTFTAGQIAAKRLVLRQALRQLKEHVQSVIETLTSASDAIAMIESVQMRVRLYTKPNKPVLAVTRTSAGGVKLTAQAAHLPAVYYWQYSVNGTWIDMPDTLKAEATLSGLTVGQTVSFRFRVRTRLGEGDFCQVVTFLVT